MGVASGIVMLVLVCVGELVVLAVVVVGLRRFARGEVGREGGLLNWGDGGGGVDMVRLVGGLVVREQWGCSRAAGGVSCRGVRVGPRFLDTSHC